MINIFADSNYIIKIQRFPVANGKNMFHSVTFFHTINDCTTFCKIRFRKKQVPVKHYSLLTSSALDRKTIRNICMFHELTEYNAARCSGAGTGSCLNAGMVVPILFAMRNLCTFSGLHPARTIIVIRRRIQIRNNDRN